MALENRNCHCNRGINAPTRPTFQKHLFSDVGCSCNKANDITDLLGWNERHNRNRYSYDEERLKRFAEQCECSCLGDCHCRPQREQLPDRYLTEAQLKYRPPPPNRPPAPTCNSVCNNRSSFRPMQPLPGTYLTEFKDQYVRPVGPSPIVVEPCECEGHCDCCRARAHFGMPSRCLCGAHDQKRCQCVKQPSQDPARPERLARSEVLKILERNNSRRLHPGYGITCNYDPCPHYPEARKVAWGDDEDKQRTSSSKRMNNPEGCKCEKQLHHGHTHAGKGNCSCQRSIAMQTDQCHCKDKQHGPVHLEEEKENCPCQKSKRAGNCQCKDKHRHPHLEEEQENWPSQESKHAGNYRQEEKENWPSQESKHAGNYRQEGNENWASQESKYAGNYRQEDMGPSGCACPEGHLCERCAFKKRAGDDLSGKRQGPTRSSSPPELKNWSTIANQETVASRNRRLSKEQERKVVAQRIHNVTRASLEKERQRRGHPTKPNFHNYGRRNTSPSRGGVMYGEYLMTHNVQPQILPNRPRTKQIYESLETKSLKNQVKKYRGQSVEYAPRDINLDPFEDLTGLAAAEKFLGLKDGESQQPNEGQDQMYDENEPNVRRTPKRRDGRTSSEFGKRRSRGTAVDDSREQRAHFNEEPQYGKYSSHQHPQAQDDMDVDLYGINRLSSNKLNELGNDPKNYKELPKGWTQLITPAGRRTTRSDHVVDCIYLYD